MKFNKERMLIISLFICAITLMITMISVFFSSSMSDDSLMNTYFLIGSIVMTCIIFAMYSFAIFSRIKPTKNIFISYSFNDQDIAIKIINELNNQLSHLSKYKFKIISNNDVSFGEDLYKATSTNISKSEIFLIVVSSSYLQKERCIKEFSEIYQKQLNSNASIIPIVLETFENLSRLPQNFSDVKALSLINCDSEEFSQQIKILALDLIKQRKD